MQSFKPYTYDKFKSQASLNSKAMFRFRFRIFLGGLELRFQLRSDPRRSTKILGRNTNVLGHILVIATKTVSKVAATQSGG